MCVYCCPLPSAILEPLLPAFITERIAKYHLKLTVTQPSQKKGIHIPNTALQTCDAIYSFIVESSLEFHTVDLIVGVISSVVGLVYFFTKVRITMQCLFSSINDLKNFLLALDSQQPVWLGLFSERY